MRDRRARGIQRGLDIESIHALPGLGIAIGDGLEGKSAGNIDQRVDRAEMSGGGIDRFFRLCCISQIDAAEFDPLGCCRELRRSMIDTGDSRAPRKGFLGDHLAKRAQRACDDNDFTLHGGLRANENESRPQPLWLGELHLQRCAALAEIDRDDTGNECR